jgi:hypothetical protein
MASGQNKRKGASGTTVRLSDFTDAMNFHINKLLGKEPTQKQQDAVAGLTPVEQKEAKKAAREALPPKPEPRPQRAPPLEGSREVKPAPRPRSAMDAERDAARDAKELAGRAGEGRAGPNSSRPATVNTQSKKPLAKRIMEALGDNRTMEDATRDRKMTEEMERERMGQKKGGMGQKKKDSVKKAYGGMGQKKKDSVKKAYGGMVKKKHGGSANKVNMKAGFTRRGCSKG